MSEKLIEGFSMEEAFRALNESPKRKLGEAFGRGASIATQQAWEAELNGECGEISDRRRAHLEKKFAKQREYERKQAEKAAAKEVKKDELPEVEEEPAMVEGCCDESVIRISKAEMEKLDKAVEDAQKEVAKYNIPMRKNSAGLEEPDFDAVLEKDRDAAKKAFDAYKKAVAARPDRAKCEIEYIDESLNESADDIVEIPAPYDKYFEISDYIPDPETSGEYQIGEEIEGYNLNVLAYLEAKPEYIDTFELGAILVDDDTYPVVEITGGRVYPIDVEDLFGESSDESTEE